MIQLNFQRSEGAFYDLALALDKLGPDVICITEPYGNGSSIKSFKESLIKTGKSGAFLLLPQKKPENVQELPSGSPKLLKLMLNLSFY